ncbi:MAG: YMGG-like glycine zipper-containing protein [Pseudomonadota bacterium]
MKFLMIPAACLGLLGTACTATGTAERNALFGAAAGAAAGAIAGEVIAGRPGQGAAIGAGVGAVTGAVVGCNRAGDCFGRARKHNDRRYDRYSDRHYYVDPDTNDTYWEDGSLRGRGRPARRGRRY